MAVRGPRSGVPQATVAPTAEYCESEMDERGELEVERDALVKEIYAAFRGVTRENGVSWSEAAVMDRHGSMEERLAARAKDREEGWEALVKDPEWQSRPYSGGWSFLDPIGFRYYLPAGMFRCVASGQDEGIQFHLTLYGESKLDPKNARLHKWSLLTPRQRACVARFARYMIKVARVREYKVEEEYWTEALESHWKRFEVP